MYIEQGLFDAMKEHLQECLPEEGCGILGGKNQTVSFVKPITNGLHSPSRFRMDGEEQLKAFLWLEKNDLELMGIFHSHPNGPNHPSPTDLEEFAYPGIAYLIWSQSENGWQVHGYQIEGSHYNEIPLYFTQSKNNHST
jgi:[CysO sulfur-carrier protein]-S-L-cysteine hydrolase